MKIFNLHPTIAILIIGVCTCCESNFTPDYPLSNSQPVINSILYADSLLALKLNWSANPQDSNFIPITNAQVMMYENGVALPVIKGGDMNGNYRYPQTVKPGAEYELQVAIPGQQNLSSSTFIPLKTELSCEIIDTTDYANIIEIKVKKTYAGTDALYFFLFYSSKNFDNSIRWNQATLYCNSPFVDPFNRIQDPSGPSGFNYSYSSFVRLDVNNLNDQETVIHLGAQLRNNRSAKLYVLTSSKAFDLYYKSAFVQRNYISPFSNETIFLPSNIAGGLGIFAGINTTLFEL